MSNERLVLITVVGSAFAAGLPAQGHTPSAEPTSRSVIAPYVAALAPLTRDARRPASPQQVFEIASELDLTAAALGETGAVEVGGLYAPIALSTRDALDAEPGRGSFAASEPGSSHGGEAHDPAAPRAMSPEARPAPLDRDKFGPDPLYEDLGYDAQAQIDIYGGKRAFDGPRPLLEIGRELYGSGELGSGLAIFGDKNRFFPQVLLFADWRTAVAANDLGNEQIALASTQLNLNLDVKLTGTERLHAFWRPFEEGADITRAELYRSDGRDEVSKIVLNPEPITAFFEGDVGSILSNLTGDHPAFDMPIAFGRVPLLFQNGVWLEDAFLGGAISIPARHSGKLDISNFDITLFAGFDEVSSPALRNARGGLDDHSGAIYGAKGFLDTREGYLEIGYGYVDDRGDGLADFSYHNFTAAFTKRYFGRVSNSLRVIANFGQDPGAGFEKTAEGVLLLFENSLITHKPSTLIPYANFWAGFERPQSLARAGGAGGVLKNTGLAFETDGMTGFPTLDATGADTFGGAVGLQYLFNLDRQIVAELAVLETLGSDVDRPAPGAQAALSVRAQQPLNDRWILRADAIFGVRETLDDVAGVRVEVRRKF